MVPDHRFVFSDAPVHHWKSFLNRTPIIRFSAKYQCFQVVILDKLRRVHLRYFVVQDPPLSMSFVHRWPYLLTEIFAQQRHASSLRFLAFLFSKSASQSPKPRRSVFRFGSVCIRNACCLYDCQIAAALPFFSPLVQRLRTCRRTQLLPLLHSAGRYWKSGCFKPTCVEITTETGRTLLIFILEYRSQGEYMEDIRHPGDISGRA